MDLTKQKKSVVFIIALAVFIGMLFVPTGESYAASADSGQKTAAPKKVKGLKAVRKGYNKIKLDWKTSKKADGYYVYRMRAGYTKRLVKVIKNRKHSYYTDEVKPGVTYRYSVEAFDKVKIKIDVPVEDTAETEEAAAAEAGAAKKEENTAENQALKASLDDQDKMAASEKKAEQKKTASPKAKKKTKTRTETLTLVGKAASVKGKTYIDVPVKFRATTASNGIKLSWKKVKYASGYKVYRYIADKGRYVCVKNLKGASNTTYVNKSVKIKKKFAYKVKATKKINGKTYTSKSTDHEIGKTVKTRSSYYDPDTSLEFLRKASTRLGCAYVGGAAGPRAFDCSGLVYWALKHTGNNYVKPARSSCSGMYASTFYKYNIGTDTSKLRRGDIVLFGHGHSFHHAAIYDGNGYVVHAACPGQGVCRSPIRWLGHVGAIIRLP